MHFIFHIKVVYNKLQFIGLIGGTHPNLGATRSPNWADKLQFTHNSLQNYKSNHS